MTGLQNCTSVILAGGLGTRLQSVVADRPKVLAEINGRPYLAYLLDQLAEARIRRVVLCTGYKGDMVKACFGYTYGSLQLTYSQETQPLGTAGALKLAAQFFDSDPVLVMNGDSYCQLDFKAAYAFHLRKSAQATMVLATVPDVERYGQVNTNDPGWIVAFEEKGAKTGPGWINAGIYFLSPTLITNLPANKPLSIERDLFPTLTDGALLAYRSSGKFIDIGTPASFQNAAQFLAAIRPATSNG